MILYINRTPLTRLVRRNQLAHACEAFGEPAIAVAASAAAESAGAGALEQHTHSDLTLSDGAGFVSLRRSEAAEVSFYRGADIPLAIFQGGSRIVPEAVMPASASCDAVKIVYTYDLEPGDYVVSFGPSAGERLAVVWDTIDHGHAEGEAHAEEGAHGHGEYDPHIWHDPNHAITMVEAIRAALVSADPANAATYEVNAASYTGKLTELDSLVRAEVSRIPEDRRKLVTSHGTFGYFAAAYGFEIVGTALGSISTEAADPSAGELAALIEQIRATGVPAIFAENVANPNLMDSIAREAGVALAPTLYTDALGEPGSSGATYLELVRYNITTIVQALAG